MSRHYDRLSMEDTQFLLSYDGNVCWGLTSDAQLVPDIDDFGDALEASFAELCEAYGVEEES